MILFVKVINYCVNPVIDIIRKGMTPKQCKMARAGLAWSADDLSAKCGVSRVTIARFEAGNQVAEASMISMQRALVDGGAVLSHRGGRLGVTVPE